MRIHCMTIAAVLALGAACSPTGADGDGYERLPGVLATSIEGEPLVEVPASAAVGQAFTVRVVTTGGGCRRAAAPGVQRTGLRADVRVWDEWPASGICDRSLQELEHVASLRFDQAGTATVRIHGQEYHPAGPAPVVVERAVTIR